MDMTISLDGSCSVQSCTTPAPNAGTEVHVSIVSKSMCSPSLPKLVPAKPPLGRMLFAPGGTPVQIRTHLFK